MLFYITLYVITLLLIIASQFVKRRWRWDFLSHALVFVAIVVLCTVAAVRDTSIGTDTSFYPLITFNEAKERGLADFMSLPLVGHEYLYYLIVYICSTVFNSFPLLLFVTEFLCVVPVYYVLSKISSREKSSKPIVIGMAIYLLFAYNLSFNMMRQMIALAFCLVAFYDYYHKKHKRALLWVVLGFFFHSFSLIAIPIIALYKICSSIRKNNTFLLFKTWLLFTIIAMSIFLLPIIRLVDSIFPNLIASSYMDDFAQIQNFSFAEFFFWTAISMVTLSCKKGLIKEKRIDRFFDVVLIVSPFAAVFDYYIHYSGRIFLYMQYIIFFIVIPLALCRKTKNRALYNCSYMIIFAAYWLFFYVLLNINETVPYAIGI